MKLFVVIVHFGELFITQKCVESLYKKEKSGFFTVVINNAQERISEENFKNKKGLHVINNPQNIGFAAGVNVGIRYALSQNANGVLLLNNDTIISNPILHKLTSILKRHEKIGVVAPAIHFTKNVISLYDLGGKLNHYIGRTSHIEATSIQNKSLRFVEYVSGCCMMIRSEVIKKIGYFDERFFLYYEDVDFCLKARMNGFNIAVDPSCIIDHALSTSAGRLSEVSTYHQIRSARIFGKKYFTAGVQLVLQRTFVIYQALVFVIKSHHASSLKALFSDI